MEQPITPYWQSECGRAAVYIGDCRKVLPHIEPEQFYAVVTDPPYNLIQGGVHLRSMKRNGDGSDRTQQDNYKAGGFMGQKWDGTGVAFDPITWEAVLRVAKPGAYLLSFGGTRTWHRMVCAIEDGGFDIRDTLMWVYGCLSEDTEILTKGGWRTYKGIKQGDTIAAWDYRTNEVIMEEVDSVTIAPYKGDMVKFNNDNTDQLLTPNHRVYRRASVKFQSDGIRTCNYEYDWDVRFAGSINRCQPIKLPLAGYHNGTGIGGMGYAELLGWVWTEGGFDATGTGVRITQSSVNSDKVEMINQCLVGNFIDAKHYTRERTYKGRTYTEHTWFFSGEHALRVRASLPDKHPTWELLWAMTLDEKRAMFGSAMLGDGSGMAFYQKDDMDREWFQVLLHCIGMQGRDNPKKFAVSVHDNPETELQRRHLINKSEAYDGMVWCVSVKSKAFLARRNGKIFITGNSGFPKSHNVSKAIDKALGAEREVIGQWNMPGRGKRSEEQKYGLTNDSGDITTPATEEAKQWKGWGTALKPAFEPICLARKPLGDTVAQCVMENSTGGLNIDGCMIGVGENRQSMTGGMGRKANPVYGKFARTEVDVIETDKGRWPANLIHDGSDEVVRFFPDEAARYFYTAKADDSDRPHGKGATAHPTVKPLDLMRYLVRLVCVKGGTVLDPFMGSGSTGCAAILEGMRFVGIEQSQEYADMAVGRLRLALQGMGEQDTPPPPKRLRGAT